MRNISATDQVIQALTAYRRKRCDRSDRYGRTCSYSHFICLDTSVINMFTPSSWKCLNAEPKPLSSPWRQEACDPQLPVCGVTHSCRWVLRGGFDGGEWGTNELALSMAGLYSGLLMARRHQQSCWCLYVNISAISPCGGLHFNHLTRSIL